MYYSENCPSYQKRYEEWMEIEDAVLTYQKQFSSDASTETIKISITYKKRNTIIQ